MRSPLKEASKSSLHIKCASIKQLRNGHPAYPAAFSYFGCGTQAVQFILVIDGLKSCLRYKRGERKTSCQSILCDQLHHPTSKVE